MADEPISALTLFTSYSTADEVEILDVSDTTFASTGTNKRIPFSTLLTMATAAGVTTVAGGGTGLTAVGSADQLLGVAHTGGALEYKTLTAGPNVTITPAAGSITIASTGGGGGGGGGMSNPMTTAGDTIYGGASGTPERLAIGTSGQVHTVVSGSPAWAAPVTETVINSVMSSDYSSITGTFSNVGLSVVLPTAGTYLITGSVRSGFTINNSVGTQAWLVLQLYDSTNSVKVPNSLAISCFGCVQLASTAIVFQGMTPLGPYIYTVTGSTTINLQAATGVAAAGSPYVYSDVNGYSTLTAVRLY